MLWQVQSKGEAPMARLIILGLVVAAVAFVVRRLAQRTARRRDTAAQEEKRFTPTVRCTRCGAYLDRSRALSHADGHTCPEHAPE